MVSQTLISHITLDHEKGKQGMKVILAGGTGFIGRALLDRLISEKQKVILLTRNPRQIKDFHNGLLKVERWDGATTTGLPFIDDGDVIVNLSGESLANGRWTAGRKEQLVQSRTGSTRALVRMMLRSGKKPGALVNGSAVGYYGHVPNDEVTESFSQGNDFLASLAGKWEASANDAASAGTRVVLLRTGVVLDKDGGALPRLMMPFNFYAGGWLGSGRQWFPWIHREDVVEIIMWAIRDENISGPVNVVAPEAVTMKKFCKTLGKFINKPCWAPVPSFVLRIALGEMATMLVGGQRVVPQVLQEADFKFKYPVLEEALKKILSK